MSNFIKTYTGKNFYLDKPEFDIEDIAHALGMICRFNGHTRTFYSVAAHSLLVAALMEHLYEDSDPFEGLMHDAHEAYLSDVPSPFKPFLPDWGAIDVKLESDVRKHWNLTDVSTEECKRCDSIALFIEAYFLIPGEGADFDDPLNVREEALKLIKEDGFKPKEFDKDVFLEAYDYYTGE